MKKSVLSLCLMSIGLGSYSQEVVYQAKIEKEQIPAAILEAIVTDFPEYTTEEFYAIPLEFVEGDVIVNHAVSSTDDYDTFDVMLEGKGRTMVATYDRYGNFIHAMEHVKNGVLPEAVRTAMAKSYPGWSLDKDSYTMSHQRLGKNKERYRMELSKGDQRIHVYTDANGNIVNNPRIKNN